MSAAAQAHWLRNQKPNRIQVSQIQDLGRKTKHFPAIHGRRLRLRSAQFYFPSLWRAGTALRWALEDFPQHAQVLHKTVFPQPCIRLAVELHRKFRRSVARRPEGPAWRSWFYRRRKRRKTETRGHCG